MSQLFIKTVEDGLHKTVFFEGSIQDAMDFISLAKRKSTVMAFVFQGQECAGYAWLTPINGNYAFPHFCFFKEVWGKTSHELGEMLLRYWFSWEDAKGPLLDVLIGVIPDFNVKAQHFVEDVGAVRLGMIPRFFRDRDGTRRDGAIYYWTQE